MAGEDRARNVCQSQQILYQQAIRLPVVRNVLQKTGGVNAFKVFPATTLLFPIPPGFFGAGGEDVSPTRSVHNLGATPAAHAQCLAAGPSPGANIDHANAGVVVFGDTDKTPDETLRKIRQSVTGGALNLIIGTLLYKNVFQSAFGTVTDLLPFFLVQEPGTQASSPPSNPNPRQRYDPTERRIGNYYVGSYYELGKLPPAVRQGKERHHIIQNASMVNPNGMTAIADYSYSRAPNILLKGRATDPTSEHGKATGAQKNPRSYGVASPTYGTYDAERRIAMAGLGGPNGVGIPAGDVERILEYTDTYFIGALGFSLDYPPTFLPVDRTP